jgi:hypothetical protein
LTAAGTTALTPSAKMLLDAHVEFHHAFEQAFRRQAGEIGVAEFLHIQPAEVVQLERSAARSVDEVAMRIVDADQIALFFKA